MMKVWIFVIIFLQFGCKDSRVIATFDLGAFTLCALDNWKVKHLDGVDSHVLRLSNGRDSFTISYGLNSGSICNIANPELYLLARDTINGQIAYIVIPKKNGDGMYGMSIERIINSEYKISINGKDAHNLDEIIKIFRTLCFDTCSCIETKTIPLNFNSQPTGSGKTLYKDNCITCHHPHDSIQAPYLKNILNKHSLSWIQNFLSDSSQKSNYYDQYKDRNCPTFKYLDKEEIQRIMNYIN